MRKTAIVSVTVVALSLSILSAAAFAGGASHRMMGGPMLGGDLFGMMKLAADLDLSNKQRSEIDLILDEARPRAREYVYALGDSRDELRALGKETEFDESRVRALAEEHAQAMADLMVIGVRVSSQISAVLTPEQREKLTEMRASRKGRWRHHE